MIPRSIAPSIRAQIGKYPVITITGPRQSGKTTLIRTIFPDMPYFSLENPDTRARFTDDPRGMFASIGHRVVLDEVQRLPELLSYIQGIVDEDREACIILSGSHNLLMMESVTQTLAGRTVVFYLMPLSYQELMAEFANLPSLDTIMFRGGYPRIYDRDLNPVQFYQSYVDTYIERDVRLLKNISNLSVFRNFLSICAAHVGQTIVHGKLAQAAGISTATVSAWLSLLETSYVIYQLNPYFKNFQKRIVKSSKLYFRDTGVVCSLLRLRSEESLANFYNRGAVYENFVINELGKSYFSKGETPPFYYWRDSNQREIDLLIDHGHGLQPIELKSGQTYRQDYFKHLKWFETVADVPLIDPTVVYGADDNWESEYGHLVSWRKLDGIVKG